MADKQTKKIIYVCDDDKNISELIKMYLENDNFEAETFDTAEKLLNALKKKEPNLITLDIMLPGMDGFDALAKIRDKSEVPVILVSAKDQEVDKVRGFNEGSDDYIVKPFDIQPIDRSLQAELQQKIDHLTKPKGSLGRLEELALQIGLIQHTLNPSLNHPCHLLLGGDHGIEREGVSVSPREVTWQQMINFTHGGGGVNMFCRQHRFDLRIVDVGVDHDLSGIDGIIDRKIACGTRNFLYEPAMTVQQFNRAIEVGDQLVGDCVTQGCQLLGIGEMGIGNTSPSSIWMSLFGNIPLKECIGAGAGLDSPGIRHKCEVLSRAVEGYRQAQECGTIKADAEDVVRYFGGFEMVTAIGAMLSGAEHGLIVLVDGFIMTACAIAAIRLYPAVQDYMVFAHCGDESGHRRMLDIVGARPLLNLGLRLGEGTGALCAFPLLDSAVRMLREMNNFDNAKITKYF